MSNSDKILNRVLCYMTKKEVKLYKGSRLMPKSFDQICPKLNSFFKDREPTDFSVSILLIYDTKVVILTPMTTDQFDQLKQNLQENEIFEITPQNFDFKSFRTHKNWTIGSKEFNRHHLIKDKKNPLNSIEIGSSSNEVIAEWIVENIFTKGNNFGAQKSIKDTNIECTKIYQEMHDMDEFLSENNFDLDSGFRDKFNLDDKIFELSQNLHKYIENNQQHKDFVENVIDYEILPYFILDPVESNLYSTTYIEREDGLCYPSLQVIPYEDLKKKFSNVIWYIHTGEKCTTEIKKVSDFIARKKIWKHLSCTKTIYDSSIIINNEKSKYLDRGVLNTFLKHPCIPRKNNDFLKIYEFIIREIDYAKKTVQDSEVSLIINSFYSTNENLCFTFIQYLKERELIPRFIYRDTEDQKELYKLEPRNLFAYVCNFTYMLISHAKDNISSGFHDKFSYISHTFLHIIKKPYKKIRDCIILSGTQGTGKSMITIGFSKYAVLMEHTVSCSGAENFLNRFNDVFKDKTLAVLEEFPMTVKPTIENNLKTLITEDIIVYEAKFKNAVPTKNNTTVIILTNQDSLNIVTNDGRRFVPYHINYALKQNRNTYFNVLNEAQKFFRLYLECFLNSSYFIEDFQFDRHPLSCSDQISYLSISSKDYIANMIHKIVSDVDTSFIVEKSDTNIRSSSVYDYYARLTGDETWKSEDYNAILCKYSVTINPRHLLPGKKSILEYGDENFASPTIMSAHSYMNVLELSVLAGFLKKPSLEIRNELEKYGSLPNSTNVFKFMMFNTDGRAYRLVTYNYAKLYMLLSIIKKIQLKETIDEIYSIYKTGFCFSSINEWFCNYLEMFEKEGEFTFYLFIKFMDFIRNHVSPRWMENKIGFTQKNYVVNFDYQFMKIMTNLLREKCDFFKNKNPYDMIFTINKDTKNGKIFFISVVDLDGKEIWLDFGESLFSELDLMTFASCTHSKMGMEDIHDDEFKSSKNMKKKYEQELDAMMDAYNSKINSGTKMDEDENKFMLSKLIEIQSTLVYGKEYVDKNEAFIKYYTASLEYTQNSLESSSICFNGKDRYLIEKSNSLFQESFVNSQMELTVATPGRITEEDFMDLGQVNFDDDRMTDDSFPGTPRIEEEDDNDDEEIEENLEINNNNNITSVPRPRSPSSSPRITRSPSPIVEDEDLHEEDGEEEGEGETPPRKKRRRNQ